MALESVTGQAVLIGIDSGRRNELQMYLVSITVDALYTLGSPSCAHQVNPLLFLGDAREDFLDLLQIAEITFDPFDVRVSARLVLELVNRLLSLVYTAVHENAATSSFGELDLGHMSSRQVR